MSARTVKAFETHCAAQGHAVPKPVNITGRIPQRRATTAPQSRSAAATAVSDSHAESVALRGGSGPMQVTDARPAAAGRLAVTVTLGELRELMRDAALDAMAEVASYPAPALLDRAGLARALGVATSTVDRFRREGCPLLWAGDSPRFELADCLAWLRRRSAP